MRKPIWTRARRRGAARGIRYSLALGFASLALLGVSGCSPSEGEVSEESGPPTTERGFASMAERRETSKPELDPLAAERDQGESPVVLFLGTSLTAGYGLPESQAFPALIQERIVADELDYRVINAGVSGDTSAGGLRRLDWLLRLPIAALVLELGANDMLRGQSIHQLRLNLETILVRTAKAHPDARFLVVGMRAAPNLGPDYVTRFDAIYPELASKFGAALVPFLLQDVAARRQLNQADGIHPTAEGHVLIAERVWTELRALLP
jgi:acyl-CoA thioesterase-1